MATVEASHHVLRFSASFRSSAAQTAKADESASISPLQTLHVHCAKSNKGNAASIAAATCSRAVGCTLPSNHKPDERRLVLKEQQTQAVEQRTRKTVAVPCKRCQGQRETG